MIAGISVRGIDQADARLARLEQDLLRAEERTVARASVIVREKVVERMSDAGGHDAFWGRTGGRGDTLASRSGQSRARITPAGQTVRVADRVFAEIGSPDEHVAFLEEGGTITSPSYLRIPTAAAQTAQGVDRYVGKSIRDIPGAFLMRSKKGNLWAARRRGGLLELLYLLKSSVTIRGRHVFAGARKDAEPEVGAVALAEIGAAVRRANG